jgi:lipopolysaccharide/colanic/teichoic acid biosynthesis glycosyltransferase
MILVTLSFWGWLFIWQNAVFDEGMRFAGLREEPLESPVNRFVKRAMDLAVAVPVVALVLPATTLAVWLAQRFQSPGPVFLFQTRSGMMGRPFVILSSRLAKTRHRQTACSCAWNWANSSTSSRPARISSSWTARPSWAPTMPPCSCTRRPCPVARRGRTWRNFF